MNMARAKLVSEHCADISLCKASVLRSRKEESHCLLRLSVTHSYEPLYMLFPSLGQPLQSHPSVSATVARGFL